MKMNWNSTKAPISDIREWRDDKKLEIRPDFQRKAVWSKAAQIMLIDSIIKNIPMPKIYLEAKMENGVKNRIVIDGQQRLTAIFDYIDGKFVLPRGYGDNWENLKFNELGEDEQNIILSYEIDINCLNNPTQEEVNSLYSRVNKYTVQLNKQELRRADYPGDFIKLAEKLADLEFFVDSKMFTAAMTRRMLDIEFVEELLCIVIEGIQNKKDTLDSFCEKYQVMPEKEIIEQKFTNILEDIALIFTDGDEMFLGKSRFRQRSDFYSLFALICQMHKDGRMLDLNKVVKIQTELKILDKEIDPYAENEEFREYAIHCTSDANSSASRNWRVVFLKKRIDEVYR